MKPTPEIVAPGNDLQTTSALVDERQEGDDNLERERELVDSTVYQIQHDQDVAPTVRRAMRELRGRLRRQRQAIDDVRTDSRRATDAAVESDHRSSTDDLNRAEQAKDSADTMLVLHRSDAHRGLWSILAELDVIASSVQAIRLRTASDPAGRDLSDLSIAIEVASDRVLELVGDMLDPDDNRGRYHEVGGSG